MDWYLYGRNLRHERVNIERPKVVKHTLKILQQMLQIFKVYLTVLERYALKWNVETALEKDNYHNLIFKQSLSQTKVFCDNKIYMSPSRFFLFILIRFVTIIQRWLQVFKKPNTFCCFFSKLKLHFRICEVITRIGWKRYLAFGYLSTSLIRQAQCSSSINEMK